MRSLDQVLRFEREVATDDGAGGYSVAWTEAFTDRARINPIGGRELVQAQQLAQVSTHRVRMRHHPGRIVSVDMRVVWRTKVLNIISAPDPGPRSLWRELIVQEGGAA